MTNPVTFVQETVDELKKVTWPTRQEALRLTFVVIFVSIVVGLFIGALDLGLTKLFEAVVK